MTDFDIRHAVLAAIEAAPDMVCTAIGVTVRGGVVTLTGRVATFAEKDAAGRVALRAEGVRGVANELDVCDADESYVADEVIAAQIAEHLRRVRDRINVQVTVTKGSVTLSGAVDHEDQRRALRVFAQRIEGVAGVYDHMTARGRGAV